MWYRVEEYIKFNLIVFYFVEMNLCKMCFINKWEGSLNILKIKFKGKSMMILKEFS